MLVFEMIFGGVMSRKMIPQDHDLAAVMTMQIVQKKNDVFKACRPLEDRETKFQKMTMRRSCDETDARMVMASRRFEKDRRFADRSPGAAAIRREGKTAFIPYCQRQTVFVGFFLIRVQTYRRQCLTAAGECFVDLTFGF